MSLKRSAENTPTKEPKRSNVENENEDNNSDTEGSVGTISYKTTNVDDVYVADAAPSPKEAQTHLEDWDSPVILIITRKTRDNYMKFLNKMSNFQETPEQEQSIYRSTSATITTAEKTEFNFIQADELRRRFERFQKEFNNTQQAFREHELKENLETAEDLEKFRKIRKELTNFFVLGHKTVNMTNKIQNGQTDYLLKGNLNVIPNRLQKDFVDKVVGKVQAELDHANQELFNATIETCHNTLDQVKEQTYLENHKIVAKAWRTVKLSNKDIPHLSFRDRRQLTEPEDLDRKPQKHSTTYRDRQTDREDRTRPTYHRNRRDSYRGEENYYRNRRESYRADADLDRKTQTYSRSYRDRQSDKEQNYTGPVYYYNRREDYRGDVEYDREYPRIEQYRNDRRRDYDYRQDNRQRRLN